MFATKMFGVLALAVLAMSATTERQDDSEYIETYLSGNENEITLRLTK